MLVAALSFTNCAQEIVSPEDYGAVEMEFTATMADSKTVNDGISTYWAEGDALTVFYAEAGTDAYSENVQFKIKDVESGAFSAVLPAPLSSNASYDWYAQYPYSSYVSSPANRSKGYITVASKASDSQVQTAPDSRAHIAGPNYPLFGKSLAVPGNEAPSAVMSHATSLLEIVVTNESADEAIVSSVSFTAPEDIVGTYYVDFTGEDLVFTSSGDTYVSATATLEVKPAVNIPAGGSSRFYLAVKPFTAPADATLALAINGGISKESVLAEAKTFESGVVNTLNYTIEADEVVVEPQEIVSTIADFIAAADGFNTYILTGVITSVNNETYGNFYIQDETGELYIYGLSSPDGVKKYWAESGVQVGDTITVKGSYTLYGTTHEMVDAIYVSHKSPVEPEEPEVPGVLKVTLTLTNAEICAAMTSTSTSYADYTIDSESGVWTVNASQYSSNTYLQCRGRKGGYIKTPEFDQDIKSVTIHFSSAKAVYSDNVYCVFPSTWTVPTEDAAYPEDGNAGKAVTDGTSSLTIPVNSGNKQVYISIIGTYAYYLDHIDVSF